MPDTQEKPNPSVELKLVEIIDFDKLPDNGIVIVRVKENSPQVQMAFANQLHYINSQLSDVMKKKKLVIMLTDKDFTFESVDEAAMNQVGWFKKEEKRIIS